MTRVTVLGDSLIDLNFTLPRQFLHRYSQNSRIELPFGDKLSTEGYELLPGGSGANVAVGLQVAGLDVELKTVLADDLFGQFLQDQISARGVSLRAQKHEGATPLSVILRVGGERTIVTGRPAVPPLALTALPSRGHLHLGPAHGQTEKIFQDLISHQIKTGQALSLNPSIETIESRERSFSALLRGTKIIFVNKVEALSLARLPTRTEPTDILQALSRLGPQIVCLTDGEKGGYVTGCGQALFSPALTDRAERVDATGAGDAFASGFLAGYLLGERDDLQDEELLRQALSWAIVNSSAAVTVVGGQTGLLTAEGLKAESQYVVLKKLT